MIWVLLAGLMIVCLLLVLRLSSTYRIITADDFSRLLRELAEQLSVGGVLIIHPRSRSRKFVQFAHRPGGRDRKRIRFGFPDAPWSREFFEPIRNMLSSAGIVYRVEATGESRVRRFLHVDFLIEEDSEEELEKAARLALDVLRLMGVRDEEFKARLEGELSPDYYIPIAEEALRNNKIPRFIRPIIRYSIRYNHKRKAEADED